MRSDEKTGGNRPFDWPAFLGGWNTQACAAVASMLLRFGIAGPRSQGILEYIRADANARPIPTDLLEPLQGSVDTSADVDRVLQEGGTRLRALADLVDLRHLVSYEWAVIRNGGLFFKPATAADVEAAARRLNIELPPSYKAFLRSSNGWLTTTSRLLGVEAVRSLGEKDPQYVKDWSLEPPGGIPDAAYNVYGKDQLPYNFRAKYLNDCLVIADPLIAMNERLLLNPHVRFADAEWESWFMSPSLAGAIRFKSFVELMRLMKRTDEEGWRRLLHDPD